jgi:hypothetical protein
MTETDSAQEKRWGSEPYWGLGFDWDFDWLLTSRQRKLRDLLIEMCQDGMRANAERSDRTLTPSRSTWRWRHTHSAWGR